MADFSINMSKVLNLEGGYQNDPNDSVNICGGVNAGTKYGISALAYQAYYGQCPSPDTMENLTVSQAEIIGKGNYWDKINGDNIDNQSVANLMFDFIWGSGQSQISNLKSIANAVGGLSLTVNANAITDDEIDQINGIDQEQYFNTLKQFRIDFFNKLGENPTYAKYLKGWLNRINTFQYVGNVKKK